MSSRTEYLKSLQPRPLSPEELEHLRQVTNDGDTYSSLACPICTESMATSTDIIPACNSTVKHYFHHNCILQWFSTTDRYAKYRRHCPMCRKELFLDESAYMPTPFRHGVMNRAEVLWWWTQVYSSIDNTDVTSLLPNDNPLPEIISITEIGAWYAAQSNTDINRVKNRALLAKIHYIMKRRREAIDEPSWMTIYGAIANREENYPSEVHPVPYIAPGQPPAWLPITELGAWMMACTNEERDAIERRGRIVKEAYRLRSGE